MGAELEFFATDASVAMLEQLLESGTEEQRIESRVVLAWQLRQRDTQRSLSLVEALDTGLVSATFEDERSQKIVARMRLIRAEAHLLNTRLDEASQLVHFSLREYTALDDDIGISDANWLFAMIAIQRGESDQRDAFLAECITIQADPSRVMVAEAVIARFAAFQDLPAAKTRWGHFFSEQLKFPSLAAECWIEDFRGVSKTLASDAVGSIGHLGRAYSLALKTGQMRRATVMADNTASAFNALNHHHAALEWNRRSLKIARRCGWPAELGAVLMQTANTLGHLNRYDSAVEMLLEALDLMQAVSDSRDYAIGLHYLADVYLKCFEYQKGLEYYCLLEQRAMSLNHQDLIISAKSGQARVLLELNQPTEAILTAEAAVALALAQSDVVRAIEPLMVLADVYSRHTLPVPHHLTADSVPLHFLEQAMDVAEGIKDYIVPEVLFEAIARELARLGNHEGAYKRLLKAREAREKIQSIEAGNRASALQVNHATEQTRAELELNQQLVLSRAEQLETLLKLGAMGREITASLDIQSIYAAMDKYVRVLFDVTVFSIYQLDAYGQSLNRVFGVANSLSMPAHNVSLNDLEHPIAQCARNRQETVIDHSGEPIPSSIDSPQVFSMMLAPLAVDDSLWGVVTVQSGTKRVYRESELAIFGNLGAYLAIALSNALSHHELTETYKELKQAEKRLADKNAALEVANIKLEKIGLTDQLTGLYNRHFLTKHLGNDLAKVLRDYSAASKRESDFVFFLIDIDHFKKVNDTYGHAAGDMVLEQLKQILESVFRESDYLIRWGGEEFLVVARFIDREYAPQLAERLRQLIESKSFNIGLEHCLSNTASVGFAAYPFVKSHPGGVSWQQVVQIADKNLYAAKQTSRNAWVGCSYQGAFSEKLVQEILEEPEQLRRQELLHVISSIEDNTILIWD